MSLARAGHRPGTFPYFGTTIDLLPQVFFSFSEETFLFDLRKVDHRLLYGINYITSQATPKRLHQFGFAQQCRSSGLSGI